MHPVLGICRRARRESSPTCHCSSTGGSGQSPCFTETSLRDVAPLASGAQDIHCINKVWPFAWRPSLSVVYEPDLRGEVIPALFAVCGAVMLAITAVA